MQTPLWQTLLATAQGVQGVWRGHSSRALLAGQPRELRPAVQALLFDALRQLGRAQALHDRLAGRRGRQDTAHALLCVALALMCGQPPPYAPHTLVSQAVEAARRTGRHTGRGGGQGGAVAGFVNACLRRFLRERDALMQATDAQPAARWNHPAWWVDAVRADHPQHWQGILHASNQHPPMTLRVNLARIGRDDYRKQLAAAGLHAEPPGAEGGGSAAGLQLHTPCPVQRLPGFADGLASVQDAGAQRAAPLLLQGLRPAGGQPLRVLDACAAPGGKTAHLLEYAAQHGLPVQLTALEADPERARRVPQTLERLGFAGAARVLVGDACTGPAHWSGLEAGAAGPAGPAGLAPDTAFDAILLDAPCTASGISRRQPDVRWLRRLTDVAQLARMQAGLLDALWPRLAPGGRLLYCTCSVFAEEGARQAGAFARRWPQARTLPAPGHMLPGPQGDGFFYALWQQPAGNGGGGPS